MSRFYIPKRCGCGQLLSVALGIITPALPKGKLRLECGLGYDPRTKRIKTHAAAEVHNWEEAERYYDLHLPYHDAYLRYGRPPGPRSDGRFVRRRPNRRRRYSEYDD